MHDCDIMISMKQLESDIKNKIYKRIYVLAGTQSYNRKRYADALIKVFLPEDDGINLTRLYGKKVDVKELIEIAETMPFMAEKRVILLENTGLFERSCEELADYIPNIPESCVMIFSEEKANSTLKQTKAVKSVGCLATFSTLSDKELRDWITRRLGREHRPITEGALDLFVERTSDDLWQVSGDLEKLISYTFGKDGIRVSDVEAVMPARPEDKIFLMIDAIISHDLHKATEHYKDLLLLRTDTSRISGLLREQFRLMLHAKEMNEEHIVTKEIAETLEMKEGRIVKALPAAKKSSKITLKRCMEMCADTDERIRSGLIDETVGVESLIASLCEM